MFIMYMTKLFYTIAFLLRAVWFIFVINPLLIIIAGFEVGLMFGIVILFLFILTIILLIGPDKPLPLNIIKYVLAFFFGALMMLRIILIIVEFIFLYWPSIILFIIVRAIVDCINAAMIRRN